MAEGRRILLSPTKIKIEPESDSDFEVSCRLCDKTFASCVALQNHARMSHVDAYDTGNTNVWTKGSAVTKSPKPVKPPKPNVVALKKEAELKTKEILSAMKPTNITSLASKNVSYIIIKTEKPPESKKKVSKKKEAEQKKSDTRKRKSKKERADSKVRKMEALKTAEAITGPFECLEASKFGADGTCHQMFFSCCEYSEHQLNEHARPRRRAARCQVCERLLSQLHQDGEPKEFACEYCSDSFDLAEQLDFHKKQIHQREKRFPCSVCQKSFFSQGGLAQHMRCHTGDRPFECTFCPKAFTQKSGLEQHVRTHTKEKPFRCVVCSKSFIQTVHLKQHMRTHTNVTPFQCAVCLKRFKQSSHLNYHLKHHPTDMTPEQKQKYKEIICKIQNKEEQRNAIDLETVLAEQSIQEEGSYSVQETYTFTEVEGEERVITCEIHPFDS